MQPFETSGTAQNPQPQAQSETKIAYPTFEQGPQRAQPQPQPQTQQAGYPTSQQYPQQPIYHPPYHGQAYQQPQGYPVYQAQPQPIYLAYNPGVQQTQDTFHKQLLVQQLQRNVKGSGQGLVALYSLLVVGVSAALIYIMTNDTSFQLLGSGFQKYYGHYPAPDDILSNNACQAYLAGPLVVPYYLIALALINFIAVLVSAMGVTGCMFFQALAAIGYAGLAVFVSQQKCVAFKFLTSLLSAEYASYVPQNAWPYFAGMACASAFACMLNYCWNVSKTKAERDQRNLALMMAA